MLNLNRLNPTGRPAGRFILALLAVAALVGCGGSGHNSTTNPYAGSYNGTWTSTDGDTGTADIVVDSTGHYSGTTSDTTASLSGTLSGAVTSAGAVSATVTYPGQAAYTATGTFNKHTDGSVTGVVAATHGTTTVTSTYTFTPNTV